ncbi:retrotransposon protein, putative, ty1-copia subclass [Tanacetum coccineum]
MLCTCRREIGRSSRLNDEVVQDQRQRDDNDLQDERLDQPKEEDVEPRRSKRAKSREIIAINESFKKKIESDGPCMHRARLVIKEFRQREGLDYFDTYSPVTRITSTRMVLAIAALKNLEVHLMDVKLIFLNGDLKEEIYMNQPQGFIAPGLERNVCSLF